MLPWSIVSTSSIDIMCRIDFNFDFKLYQDT